LWCSTSGTPPRAPVIAGESLATPFPLTPDSVRIPREDFAARRRALGAALAERGFAGWVACADDRPFSGGDHVRWLCDFQAHFEPVVLAGRGEEALLVTGPESSGLAALDVPDVQVRAARELAYPGLEYASIELIDGAAALRRLLGDGRVAVVGEPGGAAPLLGELELVAADEVAYALRAVKTDAEHAVIDACYAVALAGLRAAAGAIAAGASEREIAAEADAAMRRAGAEGFTLDTMVGSGERSRTILARSTHRRPAPGEIVAVTVLPRYEGYVCSLARPFVLGENAAAAAAIETAWRAQEAAVEQLAAGAPGSRATEAARAIAAAADTGAAVDEVWVHSMGVMEFEPPYFTPGADAPLQDGMAISIDVPFFFAPWGGLRIEDGFRLAGGSAVPRVADRRDAFPWQL
jgi:Xaa-Pro aminopeptidase